MGSISTEEYDEMVYELETNISNILKMNVHYFKTILEDEADTDYMEYIGVLEVPKHCKYIQDITLHNYNKDNKTEVWIAWNHVILMKMTHEELQNRVDKALGKQQKWRDIKRSD